MSATTQSPHESGGDKGFTASMAYVAGCRGGIMSKWEAEKAERNRRSIARLTKSLPCIFPSAVLSRARVLDRAPVAFGTWSASPAIPHWEDGRRTSREHWDVLQDEASAAESKSGLPMLIMTLGTVHATDRQYDLHHWRRFRDRSGARRGKLGNKVTSPDAARIISMLSLPPIRHESCASSHGLLPNLGTDQPRHSLRRLVKDE